MCFCVKLESSALQYLLCKSARLDQSKIRLNRSKLVQIVFLQIFPTQAQAHMMCRVLCFALSIKEKTIATFYSCCLCCVYESLVRSRGVCLHTYLRLSRSRLMLRAWWSFQLLHKELKENTSGVLVVAVNPRKKQSVDSELSCGRGSKFSARGSNRMFVV